MEFPLIVVLGLLAIAAAAVLGPRLGVAAPLLLVAVGIGVSLLPFVPAIEIEPHWILAGVLPPLLYSASVGMPTMNFRREFTAIGGLSVLLVVVSALVVGALFAWLIPGLGLATGVALGAIVSPTDAVATTIVRRLGVSPRIVAVLEGESLLNDATALVALRGAIAATAAAVSFWTVLGDFVFAVAVAVIIGIVVGKVNLLVRARLHDATVNTVISFAVPFLASVPAEALGASGLVAAVVAGLITGHGAIRYLSPQHRLSDSQNWRAIEMILEGAVFLIMGLELYGIVDHLNAGEGGVPFAIGVACAALVLVLLVRAAYIAPLLGLLALGARRAAAMKPHFVAFQDHLDTLDFDALPVEGKRQKRLPTRRRVEQVQTSLRRRLADIDYFLAEPLGWREGSILVWAGMRGAVTLAAAQTLPEETPNRALLILIAFLVAVGSLLLQGGTLPWLIRLVRPALENHAAMAAERVELQGLLAQAAERAVTEHGTDTIVQRFRERAAAAEDEAHAAEQAAYRRVFSEIVNAQRAALLAARDDGLFSAETLTGAQKALDAAQINAELRGEFGKG